MLYVITGPAGVGKSTISNALSLKLDRSVVIEGDELYHQIRKPYIAPWKEGNHLDVMYEASEKLIDLYQSYKYDIIYNYIVTEEMIKNFKEKYKDVKFICLLTSEEELLKRDEQRPLDSRMGERCKVLLESFKNQEFVKDYILDTTNMTVDEVIEEFLENDKYLY
jgi:2-phosphoglycerate kinase